MRACLVDPSAGFRFFLSGAPAVWRRCVIPPLFTTSTAGMASRPKVSFRVVRATLKALHQYRR